MPKPFSRNDGTEHLLTCMKHFKDDTQAPHFQTVKAYIRQNNLTLTSWQEVLWFWRRRHVEARYPAAYDIVNSLIFDNTELMPLPHNLRRMGRYPTNEQMLHAIEHMQNTVEERCSAFVCDVVQHAWDEGLPDHEVQEIHLQAKRSLELAREQAPHMTIRQVLEVWELCRKHRLPPFPTPAGSTL